MCERERNKERRTERKTEIDKGRKWGGKEIERQGKKRMKNKYRQIDG